MSSSYIRGFSNSDTVAVPLYNHIRPKKSTVRVSGLTASKEIQPTNTSYSTVRVASQFENLFP